MTSPTLRATIVIATLGAATAALPCSFAPPPIGPMAPAAGEIPRNTQIFVVNTNGLPVVAIGEDGDRFLDLEFQEDDLFHAGPLGAAGGESLQLGIGFPPDFVVLNAVTVADEDDVTAPVLSASPLAEFERFDLEMDIFGNVAISSCGPSEGGRRVSVLPARATDDFQVAGYRLYGVQDGERRVLRASVGSEPQALQTFITDREPVNNLEVVAFDLANNESEPEPVAPSDIGGCSSTAVPTGAPYGAAALLGLALLARRRRRG